MCNMMKTYGVMKIQKISQAGPIFIKVLAHLHLKPVYEFLRYA